SPFRSRGPAGSERVGVLGRVAPTMGGRPAVRAARDAPGEREAAAECCARARALAVRLALRGVTAAVEAFATPLGVEPAAATDAPPRQVVRHEGDHWTIEYGGAGASLRPLHGDP